MKILKEDLYIFSQMLQQHANNTINLLNFSLTLNLADILAAYKKE